MSLLKVKADFDSDGSLRIRTGTVLSKPVLKRVLKSIGTLLVGVSDKAFADQRLGDVNWPARYPGQGTPKLNLAGAVEDLKHGSAIKSRRFEDRPALISSGELKRSVAFQVFEGRGAVAVGSALDYANKHQSPNPADRLSKQSITDTFKETLKLFLRKQRRKAKSKKQPAAKREQAAMISKRMGFLFRASELTTRVAWRPFVGVTPEAARKIPQIVAEQISKAEA